MCIRDRSSAIFSIIPSLPIIVSYLLLVPALGRYFPWLRLSVVGSAVYETMVANMAAEAFGLESITAGEIPVEMCIRDRCRGYPLLPGSSQGIQPVVLCCEMGEDHKTLPPFQRVLMAGGPHCPRPVSYTHLDVYKRQVRYIRK